MDWPTDRGLQARMVGTLALVAGVTAVGAAAAYVLTLGGLLVVAVVVPGVPPAAAPVAAAVVAAGLVVGVAASELWLGRGLGLPEVDARAVDREFHPALAGHVDRVTQQLGLPRPTVAVTEDPVPLAMTTGLTPGSATLVVSTGLLAVLDDDELAAVVAHELAHVRNRDAAVTTLASLPMVVADAVRQWAAPEPTHDDDEAVYAWETEDGTDVVEPGYQVSHDGSELYRAGAQDQDDDGNDLGVLVFAVATAFWFVGRVLLSLLSRYRELAADRAAVAVTGSPAALAGALRTLTEADRPPGDDRRTRHAVDAFAIVPEDPPEPVRLGPEGQREQTFAGLMRRVNQVTRTHPDPERRLAALRDLQEHVETVDRI
jgi:heat shock protein HtpX